jgi:hypothetical protein
MPVLEPLIRKNINGISGRAWQKKTGLYGYRPENRSDNF